MTAKLGVIALGQNGTGYFQAQTLRDKLARATGNPTIKRCRHRQNGFCMQDGEYIVRNAKQETGASHRSSPTAAKAAPPSSTPARLRKAINPTSVVLSQHERDALQAAAKSRRLSTSAMMRQAIQDMLA